jgi:hypothetical protein
MGGGSSWSARIRENVAHIAQGKMTASYARILPGNIVSYEFPELGFDVHIHFLDSRLNEIVAAHLKSRIEMEGRYKIDNYEASMIDYHNKYLLD